MESFNWIDIDGIRYRWDGEESIVCTGRFGYQTSMTGDRISSLELESEDGEVAGTLNVDFAAAHISFTPAAGASLLQMMVLVGHEQGQQEYSLQSLSDCPLQELLSYGESLDWSALAVPASAHALSPTHTPPQGQVLSWDSFHFEEESLLGPPASVAALAGHGSLLGSEISINIDITDQVLGHIPPLHEM